jgi:hypothetical protein
MGQHSLYFTGKEKARLTLKQCCGSGSTWIPIHLTVLDPDPHSQYGSSNLETGQNLQINLVLTFTYFKCLFQVKIQLYVTDHG